MVVISPTYGTEIVVDTTKLFIDSMMRVDGIPRIIVSDHDSKFTSHFWKEMFKNIETTWGISYGFHPQIDGQVERANKTIEEMLRAYVGRRQNSWDQRLSWWNPPTTVQCTVL